MILRLVLILCLSFALLPKADAKIQNSHSLISTLESLPVQDQGRQKPFLVFADEFLLAIAGTSRLTLNQSPPLSAMQIITHLWITPNGWEKIPLILVKERQLKAVCGLSAKEEHFSFQDLRDNPRLQLQILEAQELQEKNSETKLSQLSKAAEDVATRMILLAKLTNGSAVRIIPSKANTAWTALPSSDPRFVELRKSYLSNDTSLFESAVNQLKSSLLVSAPPYYRADRAKIQLELFYQKLHPFRWAWIIYTVAGIILFLIPSRYPTYATAWILTLIGLLFQITGFVCRIVIAGRPPVTNMYESIIWVAFGTILFSLIFESFYRSRFFLAGAIPIATVSLILADTQPLILSHAIHPLTAVLQSNFWLTIHVLTITLSYAAFALAMAISHIALGKILFRQSIPPLFYNYIYRVLQVGVLLLACGTILGGVWANYSWGRFWNWDPKETWALITLLIYLIILHGRIAGKWDGLGLAVGSVIGFLSVLMAWYGVNFVLGTGLHSYGFGTGGFQYVISGIVLDALFVIFALIRSRN